MKAKMPTHLAEKIYPLLVKLAGASSNRVDRELFIFHYCVFSDSEEWFDFEYGQGQKSKRFIWSDGLGWVEGEECERVNNAIKKLLESEAKNPKR